MVIDKYWEDRGRLSYSYKREEFYTITPIPLYVERRRLLLEFTTEIISLDRNRDICDFGCGDGWYISYFSSKFRGKNWFGTDISMNMLQRANKRCPYAELYNSLDSIDKHKKFNLIYGFAVFAHIMDDNILNDIFAGIAKRLAVRGNFLLFEQVAPFRSEGQKYVKRRTEEYISMCEKQGLKCEDRKIIRFIGHQYFERRIAKLYYRFLSKGATDHEKRLNANKHLFFRLLSSIFLNLSKSPIQKDDGQKWGNCYLVFSKV